MEKHDGNESPLWSFVDDVRVGEPVVVRKNKTKVNNRSVTTFRFMSYQGVCLHVADKSNHRTYVNIYITLGRSNLLYTCVKNQLILMISKPGK